MYFFYKAPHLALFANNKMSDKVSISRKPKLINLHEYEEYLQNNLPKPVRDYYHSGANDMITLRENRAAFPRYAIIPRILRDVSTVNIRRKILGNEISCPICIAPTALQKMAHPEGELATARAAARFNTVMALSSLSTTCLEDTINAGKSIPAPDQGFYWFQLYAYKNEEITRDLIQRAETSGYQAIVLTVDTPMLGRREPDLRNYFSLPSHLILANFQKYYQKSLENKKNHDEETVCKTDTNTLTMNTRPTIATHKTTATPGNNSAIANYFTLLIDDGLTWATIDWIKRNTKLKVILKGILRPDDAARAVEHAVDGIWISNHGARQLDTVPATIEMLSSIKKVVRDKCEIYLDGGITRGTDIFKAIALGANAVFLGRPVLWGLAYEGEEGVLDVLNLLKEELVLAMKLAGCVDLKVR
jgi:(S)-2-hydroxy-acid oxidase